MSMKKLSKKELNIEIKNCSTCQEVYKSAISEELRNDICVEHYNKEKLLKKDK